MISKGRDKSLLNAKIKKVKETQLEVDSMENF